MGTRKHVKRPSILMNFPCYFRATFKGARIFTACDNQQGKVCERYTGRNISRQVRLLSAGLKASQSLTTWMFVPNIQTMLDSNAPKNVFFFQKTPIWRCNFNLERNEGCWKFQPNWKMWVKNQSLHQNRAKHKKNKLNSPHLPKRMISPSLRSQPFPFPQVRLAVSFFWLQGGPYQFCSRVITLLSRLKESQLPMYFRPFIGVHSNL